MRTLNKLRKCDSIEDLISSFSLKITPRQFSYIVYRVKDNDKYHQFTIPKSDGTTRIISSPNKTLKYLQKEFSKVFIQCITEIQQKHPSYLAKNHAFEKYKSIASNASLHKNQKYLLNIDIKDFFSSIHYGRIIGFLQKDKYFSLPERTAKIIAKLASYHGVLPQGSPLSPILASLIGNIIDTRLSMIARKYHLVYTRYADDITFSSNRDFSKYLLDNKNNIWHPNKKLISAIKQCGFSINIKKTRYTNRYQKQVVTGVIVNRFLNVDKKYKKHSRAMVNNLLRTSQFEIYKGDNHKYIGNIDQLIGRLNHAISIKYRDRILNINLLSEIRKHIQLSLKRNLTKIIQYNGETDKIKKHIGIDRLENSFDINNEQIKKYLDFIQKKDEKLYPPDNQIKLLRNVLFYKYFIGIESTYIFTEGKTDHVYLKYAFQSLNFTKNVKIIKHNSNLEKLGLSGGTATIKKFIDTAYTNNFYVDFDKISIKPKYPVIFLLYYDDGLKNIKAHIDKHFNIGDQFAHIKENIYILLLEKLTCQQEKHSYTEKNKQTCIENLIYYNNSKIMISHDNHDCVIFDGEKISKNDFAIKVRENKNSFNFNQFTSLITEIRNIENHFKTKIKLD